MKGNLRTHFLIFLAFVVVGAFGPFVALGLRNSARGEAHGLRDALLDVLHSGELIAISTGLVAGAGGDRVLSNLLSKNRPFLTVSNFIGGYIVLPYGALAYAGLQSARHSAHPPSTKLVTTISIGALVLSVMMAFTTMWLTEQEAKQASEMRRLLHQPSSPVPWDPSQSRPTPPHHAIEVPFFRRLPNKV
jgi:hypothetical protein